MSVQVHYRMRRFPAQLAAQLSGRPQPYSAVVVFGEVQPRLSGAVVTRGVAPGAVLKIDFTSAGGSLYVRDYPNAIDPRCNPTGRAIRPSPSSDSTPTGSPGARRGG